MRDKKILRDYIVEQKLVYAVPWSGTNDDPDFLRESCLATQALREDARIGPKTCEMMNNSTDMEWMGMIQAGMAPELCGRFHPEKKGMLTAVELFRLLPPALAPRSNSSVYKIVVLHGVVGP